MNRRYTVSAASVCPRSASQSPSASKRDGDSGSGSAVAKFARAAVSMSPRARAASIALGAGASAAGVTASPGVAVVVSRSIAQLASPATNPPMWAPWATAAGLTDGEDQRQQVVEDQVDAEDDARGNLEHPHQDGEQEHRAHDVSREPEEEKPSTPEMAPDAPTSGSVEPGTSSV